MDVTLIGTGCPVACPARGGAATLVTAGAAAVLVDCGAGAAQGLVAAGRSGATLDALVVTHLHSDHLADFYQLVVSAWHQGRERPWRVICPAPVERLLREVLAAWEEERRLRIEWEKRPSATGLEVAFERLETGGTIAIGGLELTPVEVDHHPVAPAFGLICREGAQMAAISGDTRPSEALIDAGRGCDLLVHEVFIHREMLPVPGRRSAETVANVAAYHTSSADVGTVALRMEAGALALTHFVPPVFDRQALLDEVGAQYDGPVIVGEDGMRFDLGTGDVHHRDFSARIF